MKIIFESLEELILSAEGSRDVSPFLVRYRGKEHYALAETEEDAVSEVARSNGYDVGMIPLDLIISATRNVVMQQSGRPKTQTAKPVDPVEQVEQVKQVEQVEQVEPTQGAVTAIGNGEDPEEDGGEEWTLKELLAMSRADLVATAESFGITDLTGTKAVLAERIMAVDDDDADGDPGEYSQEDAEALGDRF